MPKGAIANGKGYLALDELLEIPRVRILRALRHFDWASAVDLRVALDTDERAAVAVDSTLRRLVIERRIDRIGKASGSFLYRINDAGRTQLKSMLGRASIPDSPEVLP